MKFKRVAFVLFLLSGQLLYFIISYSWDLILRKHTNKEGTINRLFPETRFRQSSEQAKENSRKAAVKLSVKFNGSTNSSSFRNDGYQAEEHGMKNNTFSKINGMQNGTQRFPVNPHDYKLLINEPHKCKAINGKIEPIFLLVLMVSSPPKSEQRNRQRKSCLSISNVSGKKVKSVFLLGNPGNNTVTDSIRKESATYHDILLEDFYDSYRNLTLKTIMGLKWASIYCPAASYVMKIHDDVFLNLTVAVNYLEGLPSKLVMTGFLWPNSVPFRNPTNKWYLSKKEYSKDRFPKYLSGLCYVLSGDLPSRVYEESLSVPYIYLEDIYIGIITERLNVTKLHSRKILYYNTAYNFCTFRDALAVHLYHPAEVATYWEKQLKMSINNTFCDHKRKQI